MGSQQLLFSRTFQFKTAGLDTQQRNRPAFEEAQPTLLNLYQHEDPSVAIGSLTSSQIPQLYSTAGRCGNCSLISVTAPGPSFCGWSCTSSSSFLVPFLLVRVNLLKHLAYTSSMVHSSSIYFLKFLLVYVSSTLHTLWGINMRI